AARDEQRMNTLSERAARGALEIEIVEGQHRAGHAVCLEKQSKTARHRRLAAAMATAKANDVMPTISYLSMDRARERFVHVLDHPSVARGQAFVLQEAFYVHWASRQNLAQSPNFCSACGLPSRLR